MAVITDVPLIRASPSLNEAGGNGSHYRRTVDQGKPLLVAEFHGLDVRSFQRIGSRHDFTVDLRAPLARANKTDAGERAQIATRTQRAFFGNAGQDATIVHLHIFFEILYRYGRVAAAQRVDACEHRRPYIVIIQIRAAVALHRTHNIVLRFFGM